MIDDLDQSSSAFNFYNWQLQKIPKCFGVAISSKTLANLDSLGQGPEGAFKLGRTVVYPTASLLNWLQQRTTFLSSGCEGGEK